MSTNLSPNSRVWIYQSSRKLTAQEVATAQQYLDQFCAQWTSHNNQLKAKGIIVEDLFFVLMADETQAGASGCSIDKSVHFMKSLGQELGIDLFDRMTFAYEQDGGVQLAKQDQFATRYKQGAITKNTIVYDTLVKTKKAFDAEFRKPLESSWHQRFI